MGANYIGQLIELAGALEFTDRPTAEDWRLVENDIGLEFPQDFKALVTAFGSGWFGAGLRFVNPRASTAHMRITRASLIAYQEMMADIASDLEIILFPKISGLVFIGGIDRQDFLLRPDGSGGLKDLVWLDIDFEQTRVVDMTVSQFIYDLYTGEIAEDWAERLRNYIWLKGNHPIFTPWRDPLV